MYAIKTRSFGVIFKDDITNFEDCEHIEIDGVPFGNNLYNIVNGSLMVIKKDENMIADIRKDPVSAKIDALSDRQSFLEDCIVEMASMVYA